MGGRKKTVYWKVSVGLKCVQMSRILAACMIVESLRLLRTNYSVKSFYNSITNFKTRLQARGYQHNLIEKITSEIKFTERKLQKNEKVRNKIIPFFTTTRRCLINLKNILKSTIGSRNIERASHLSHTKKENL